MIDIPIGAETALPFISVLFFSLLFFRAPVYPVPIDRYTYEHGTWYIYECQVQALEGIPRKALEEEPTFLEKCDYLFKSIATNLLSLPCAARILVQFFFIHQNVHPLFSCLRDFFKGSNGMCLGWGLVSLRVGSLIQSRR